jgi:hypothetical protein
VGAQSLLRPWLAREREGCWQRGGVECVYQGDWHWQPRQVEPGTTIPLRPWLAHEEGGGATGVVGRC